MIAKCMEARDETVKLKDRIKKVIEDQKIIANPESLFKESERLKKDYQAASEEDLPQKIQESLTEICDLFQKKKKEDDDLIQKGLSLVKALSASPTRRPSRLTALTQRRPPQRTSRTQKKIEEMNLFLSCVAIARDELEKCGDTLQAAEKDLLGKRFERLQSMNDSAVYPIAGGKDDTSMAVESDWTKRLRLFRNDDLYSAPPAPKNVLRSIIGKNQELFSEFYHRLPSRSQLLYHDGNANDVFRRLGPNVLKNVLAPFLGSLSLDDLKKIPWEWLEEQRDEDLRMLSPKLKDLLISEEFLKATPQHKKLLFDKQILSLESFSETIPPLPDVPQNTPQEPQPAIFSLEFADLLNSLDQATIESPFSTLLELTFEECACLKRLGANYIKDHERLFHSIPLKTALALNPGIFEKLSEICKDPPYKFIKEIPPERWNELPSEMIPLLSEKLIRTLESVVEKSKDHNYLYLISQIGLEALLGCLSTQDKQNVLSFFTEASLQRVFDSLPEKIQEQSQRTVAVTQEEKKISSVRTGALSIASLITSSVGAGATWAAKKIPWWGRWTGMSAAASAIANTAGKFTFGLDVVGASWQFMEGDQTTRYTMLALGAIALTVGSLATAPVGAGVAGIGAGVSLALSTMNRATPLVAVAARRFPFKSIASSKAAMFTMGRATSLASSTKKAAMAWRKKVFHSSEETESDRPKRKLESPGDTDPPSQKKQKN